MLIFDDLGIGGLQCRLTHQPAGSMLEVGRRQPLDAAAHGGQPEIGAVGDQGGEQRAVGIRVAWFVAGERPEGTGEATAPVDFQQDIFKPDSGHTALDQPTQGPQLGGDDKRIGAAQTQLALIDAGKAVGRQPVGEGRRGTADLASQLGKMFRRPLGQAEIGIAGHAGTRPQAFVQYQRPEPGVLTAVGKVEVAGTQCIADGHRQRGFPERAPELAMVVAQRFPPARGDKIRWNVVRQGLDGSLVEAADRVECNQQVAPPGVGCEGQRPEGRQRFAQIGITGDHRVDHTARVIGGDGTACHQRAFETIGADPLAQPSHGFLAITGEHGLTGVDQRDQPHFRRLPQLPGVGFGRMAGAAHQPGHVVVVRLDHVIQQSLPAIEQEAGEQAVAFGRRKAAQGMTVIVPAQFGELSQHPMRNVAEVGQTPEQRVDLLQPLARGAREASHRAGRRRPVTADGCLAINLRVVIIRVTDQAVESGAGGCGEPPGDASEQRVEGLTIE